MKAWQRLEAVLTAVVALSSVIVAGFYVRTQVAVTSNNRADTPATYYKEWETAASAGSRFGSRNAEATLMVYNDFECPYCKLLAADLPALQKKFGGRLAVVYMHFPLRNHAHAEAAAVAAECADDQGVLGAVHDVLFEHQRGLSENFFPTLPDLAGIPDTAAFQQCMKNDSAAASVRRQREWGDRMKVTGTPTVLVNGWKLKLATAAEIERAIQRALDGESPVK